MLLELFDKVWIVSVNNLRESKRLLYFAWKYGIDSHFSSYVHTKQIFYWTLLLDASSYLSEAV